MGAFIEPFARIFQKITALYTERAISIVISATVKTDHLLHNIYLLFYAQLRESLRIFIDLISSSISLLISAAEI